MSLTYLWENSRDQLEDKHLQQIIAFADQSHPLFLGHLRRPALGDLEETLFGYLFEKLFSSFHRAILNIRYSRPK